MPRQPLPPPPPPYTPLQIKRSKRLVRNAQIQIAYYGSGLAVGLGLAALLKIKHLTAALDDMIDAQRITLDIIERNS